MPRTNVNDALVAYQNATDLTRTELENSLIKSLSNYAKKIVWLKLNQDRPDVVNEAVQYVMAHLADFRGDSKFSTWVYSGVERYCFRELKRKIDGKEKVFSDFPEYQVEGLASYELDGEARMTLDRLTKTLSADEKHLIDLKLQGYSTAELAQLMKITETAVEGRWRRLSAKLRKREQKRTKNLTKTTLISHFPQKRFTYDFLRPDFEDYKKARLKEGASATTVNIELSILRGFWRFMLKMDSPGVMINPVRGVRVKVPSKKRKLVEQPSERNNTASSIEERKVAADARNAVADRVLGADESQSC